MTTPSNPAKKVYSSIELEISDEPVRVAEIEAIFGSAVPIEIVEILAVDLDPLKIADIRRITNIAIRLHRRLTYISNNGNRDIKVSINDPVMNDLFGGKKESNETN